MNKAKKKDLNETKGAVEIFFSDGVSAGELDKREGYAEIICRRLIG